MLLPSYGKMPATKEHATRDAARIKSSMAMMRERCFNLHPYDKDNAIMSRRISTAILNRVERRPGCQCLPSDRCVSCRRKAPHAYASIAVAVLCYTPGK